MARTLEEIYQQLGIQIAQAIDAEWSRAWVVAEVKGESALDLQGWYQPAGGGEPKNFSTRTLARDFMSLYLRLRRDDQSPWRKATLTLEPAGEFKLDLEY